jgi:DNA-binding transcriptional MerR regulator
VLEVIGKMLYTVKQLSDMGGVSVRTLHYYDEIGLLKPGSYGDNGYRYYGDTELLKLQQILFFRELDFSLNDIGNIFDRPNFDLQEALHQHRELLLEKANKLQTLIETVDRTILMLKGEIKMEVEELYEGFEKPQIEKYRKEARELYGETVVEESERKSQKYSKAEWQNIMAEGTTVLTAIRDNMPSGFDSPEVQAQVKKLHQWVNHFYNCTLEIFEGLGHMYNENPDFVKMYQTKYHPEMPGFLFQAIEYYCQKNKS